MRPASRQRQLSSERGEIASAVILAPVAILAVMLAIQAGLVFHARSLVQTAAQDAARAAQAESATAAEGEAAGLRWIPAGGLLEDPAITVTRTDTQVDVVASSGVISLVPFWDPTVIATVSGPVEVFRPQSERS